MLESFQSSLLLVHDSPCVYDVMKFLLKLISLSIPRILWEKEKYSSLMSEVKKFFVYCVIKFTQRT